ncbi:MAG: PAS domain S-box protein, partial [Fibrobacteria bacterium]
MEKVWEHVLGPVTGSDVLASGLNPSASANSKTPDIDPVQAPFPTNATNLTTLPMNPEAGSFRLLFSQVPDAKALADGDKLLETNPAWDELFGYPGMHSGVTLARFLPDPLLSESGPLTRIVSEGVDWNGARFPIELSAHPFPWQGRDLRLVSALSLPERRGGEGVEPAIGRLRNVLANAPIVLFALDGKGTVTFCEGRGLEPLGISSRQAIGKSAFELCRRSPQDRLNLHRALSGEEFTVTSEFEGLWYEIHFSPVFKGYDDVAGVVGVGLNVTDRHKAAEALRRSDGQLRHARKMDAIGRVASGVTRDFLGLLALLNASGDAPRSDEDGMDSRGPSLEEFRNLAEKSTQLKRRFSAIGRNQALALDRVRLNRLVGGMDKDLR